MKKLCVLFLLIGGFFNGSLGQNFSLHGFQLYPENPIENENIEFSFSITGLASVREVNTELNLLEGERTFLMNIYFVLLGPPGGFWYERGFEEELGRLSPDNYNLQIRLYWDNLPPEDRFWRLDLEFDTSFVVSEAGLVVLSLASGWNIASLHIMPRTVEIPELLSPLVDGENLLLVKDFTGRFYNPQYNYNGIPFWDFQQGYQIKMERDAELELHGRLVEEDTPISLRQGWSMVAYFPEAEVEAPEAFRSINDVLLMAKDGQGCFYIPEHNFNNMPPLMRGQGYQVKVSQDVDLIWFVP